MSGKTVTPASEVPVSRPAERRWRADALRSPVTVVIIAATLVALALRLFQLSRPGMLLGVTEYDDGPYFGSALRLSSGVLPYRDFILVQPPGITLLMLPAALLAKLTGTAWGMAFGRILTTLASAAGVALLGLLVRHRGVLATLVACGTLAVFPYSIAAAHTVLVEAWLVLFCLAGALMVFDRDRLASGKRLVWGGVAFGFAGAIEPWAIVPVLVVFALCLPRVRRAATFAAGVAAGFLVPVLPFAALDPPRFYQSTIVAQIGHRAAAVAVPMWTRLRYLTGLSDTHLVHRAALAAHLHLGQYAIVALTVAALAVLIAGGLLAVVVVTSRPPAALEWFAAASTVLIVAMFLWPSQFHYHFPAFLAPFLALAIALPVARLVTLGRTRRASRPDQAKDAAGDWLQQAAVGGAVIVLVVLAAVQAKSETALKAFISQAGVAAAGKVIPAGSCVATDMQTALILANRFSSDVPGCPLMVDGIGTDLALSGGLKPATGAGAVPAVAAVWRQEFTHAQFAWLSPHNDRRIAWNPALWAYFTSNFTLVENRYGDKVYQRRRS